MENKDSKGQQFGCVKCGSTKLQFILFHKKEGIIIMDFICISCGDYIQLKIKGDFMDLNSQEPKIKKEVAYI